MKLIQKGKVAIAIPKGSQMGATQQQLLDYAYDNELLQRKLDRAMECLERVKLDNRGMVFRGMIASYLKQIEEMK